MKGCRRIGTLYLREKYFACRHCSNLTYESNRLSGSRKKVGRIISIGELDYSQNDCKRQYYNGKKTRKYRRFIRVRQKFHAAYTNVLIKIGFNRSIIDKLNSF